MAIQFGPAFFSTIPGDASDVTVTTRGGSPVTLATPVSVDGEGRVSFAVDQPGTYSVWVRDSAGYGVTYRVTLSGSGGGNAPGNGTIYDYIDRQIEAGIPDVKQNYTQTGGRFVADGDSITIGGITNGVAVASNQDRASNWPTYMMLASRGRVQLLRNVAVSGQRSDQALGRFDANVAPLNPDAVFLTIGTNDIGQGRTKSDWLANLEAYRLKCEAIGATLIVGAIWPSDTDSGRPVTIADWNVSLRSWAAEHGIRVVAFDTFTEPSTGGWPTGWSSDNVHPLPDYRAQIGAFAWDSLSDMFPGATVKSADKFGDGVLGNGLFTALTTPLTAPTSVTATPATGTGTLPAGAYSYRVSTRDVIGESVLSKQATATLSGTGQITLVFNSAASNRGFRVYRKGPDDLDWFLVNEPPTTASNTTWVDDGSAVPGARATGIDTSVRPTEASIGSTTPQRMDGGVTSGAIKDPSISGNWFRMRPLTTNAVSSMLLTPAGTALPGETWELTGLVRGDGQNQATVYFRPRLNTTQVTQMKAFEGVPLPNFRTGRFHCQMTMPAGIDNVLPVLACGTGEGYVEFAELRLVKIS